MIKTREYISNIKELKKDSLKTDNSIGEYKKVLGYLGEKFIKNFNIAVPNDEYVSDRDYGITEKPVPYEFYLSRKYKNNNSKYSEKVISILKKNLRSESQLNEKEKVELDDYNILEDGSWIELSKIINKLKDYFLVAAAYRNFDLIFMNKKGKCIYLIEVDFMYGAEDCMEEISLKDAINQIKDGSDYIN